MKTIKISERDAWRIVTALEEYANQSDESEILEDKDSEELPAHLNKYGYPEEKLFKVVIDDIDWDTDGEDVDLPTEEKLNIWATSADEARDMVTDELSDKYGWCVNSVSCEVLEEEFYELADKVMKQIKGDK